MRVEIWCCKTCSQICQVNRPKVNAVARATRGIRHRGVHLRGRKQDYSAGRHHKANLWIQFQLL